MTAIDFEIACARCGSSLKGCDLEGVCPSCGRLVGQTLNLAVIDIATMTVRDDVECVNCQYNLRTLSVASVCPECGTPVARSLDMRELAFASFTWLNNIRRGMTYLLAVLLAPLVLPLVAAFTTIAGIHVFPPVPCLVMVSVALPVLIGLIFSLALICAPQPDVTHPRYMLKLQGACVVLLIAAIILVLTSIAATHIDVAVIPISLGLSCVIGLFLCSAISIRYLAAQAHRKALRLLASLWTGSLALLIVGIPFLSVPWPRTQVGWFSNSQVYWRLIEHILKKVIFPWAGICYLLGLVVLVLCRRMLTAIIRRQEQQADARMREQIQHLQSQSQGAPETP